MQLGIAASGLFKQSPHAASVAQQYSGKASRMAQSKMGLAYACRSDHPLFDRERSLPAA
jgi:hypothetical protein